MAKKTKKAEEVEEEVSTHIITQEDLDANPELVAQGVNVGDEVELSQDEDVTEEVEEEVAPVKAKSKSKTNGAYAVVTTGSEYIRTYDNKEVAESFAAKESGRLVIEDANISSIVVEYTGRNANGERVELSKIFTEVDGADWKQEALLFARESRGISLYRTS